MSADGTRYRGWLLSFDYPPIPIRDHDWSATHPDFDGPEDGRHVSGHTQQDVMDAIDEWHLENDV